MATANATAPDRVCSQANQPVSAPPQYTKFVNHTPRATRTVEFVAIHPAANDDGNVLVMIGSALNWMASKQATQLANDRQGQQ